MDIKDILKKIKNITIEKSDFEIQGSFIDFAHRFSEKTGTVVLISGGELDCARYNILAADPLMTIRTKNNNVLIEYGKNEYQFSSDPFNLISEITEHFKIDEDSLPVASGLFGYLSYDLKDMIEKLPKCSVDDLDLPHMFFTLPERIFINDRKTGKTTLVNLIVNGMNKKFSMDSMEDISGEYSAGLKGLYPNFSKSEYVDAIEDIKNYIRRGHVYQVNMSQRFKTDFEGDSFSLFKDLFKKNPAPFFSYINCSDHFVVSTSPERFILRDGEKVEARPIKGTRPRGKTSSEDEKWKNDLVSSRKDDAELSMIVDLLRNDIGKVCRGNSVKVKEHKKVEAYENVYHLVSIIEGILSEKKDSADLLKATFPGGSITGCPKIRSMEIIDELESVRRNIYTGSVGYISFHDTMDFSIAIRTAVIKDGSLCFSVGGGIVYDSDPLDEYEETLHKGKTFLDAIKREDGKERKFLWINGKIVDESKASISPLNPGFQYGYGFFETILVKNGGIRFLEDHVERFNRSAKEFLGKTPDFTYKEIIEQLMEKNSFQGKTCAVKIIAAKGNRTSPPFDDNFLISIREYKHRLDALGKNALNIGIYEKPRLSYLSDHKTMNYMHLFEAGKWAASNGYDEAVILNPDGSFSETNTANIILIEGKNYILPNSPHYLKGTMEKTVCEQLHKMGYTQKCRKVFFDDLSEESSIILTNSLMGAIPVFSVNKKKVLVLSNICSSINNVLDLQIM